MLKSIIHQVSPGAGTEVTFELQHPDGAHRISRTFAGTKESLAAIGVEVEMVTIDSKSFFSITLDSAEAPVVAEVAGIIPGDPSRGQLPTIVFREFVCDQSE
jgi:hypothetical protein